ncbi:hypothetical protein SeLEV6574_g05950 [Synchytrium endobioticum]|uniref:Uncharacterized protein n=1 Tax=Synchytrium endobioticum TaxID=286115 RepID=A0A507CRL5_9FUNG|nr:hypothetical protein SeLEV6574_g05950 [Synchytrium endobioticum]
MSDSFRTSDLLSIEHLTVGDDEDFYSDEEPEEYRYYSTFYDAAPDLEALRSSLFMPTQTPYMLADMLPDNDVQSDIGDVNVPCSRIYVDDIGPLVISRRFDAAALQAQFQQEKPTRDFVFLRVGSGLPYIFVASPSHSDHEEWAGSLALCHERIVKVQSLDSASTVYAQQPISNFFRFTIIDPFTLHDDNEVGAKTFIKYRPNIDFLDPESQPPLLGDYIVSQNGSPLCIDCAYGYLAKGTEYGQLEVLCLIPPERHWIIIHRFGSSNMVNSVRIVRRMDPDGDHSKDEFFLFVALNNSAVSIIKLPRHSEHKGQVLPPQVRQTVYPKSRAPINCCQLSPDGRYLAAVGDHGYILCAPVLQPKSRSQVHNNTQDENVYVKNTADRAQDKEEQGDRIGEVWNDDEDQRVDLDEDESEEILAQGWEPGSIDHPDWSIGSCKRIDIDDFVSDGELGVFRSQCLSWSTNSQWFACSSHTHPCVLVVNAGACAVVLRLDTIGPTYQVAFHPTHATILAVTLKNLALYIFDIRPALETGGPASKQIVPVSYRGFDFHGADNADEEVKVERNQTDRVFEQLGGITWSNDGSALYLGTRWGTRYYKVMDVPTLKDLCIKYIYHHKKHTDLCDLERTYVQSYLDRRRWLISSPLIVYVNSLHISKELYPPKSGADMLWRIRCVSVHMPPVGRKSQITWNIITHKRICIAFSIHLPNVLCQMFTGSLEAGKVPLSRWFVSPLLAPI